jgi:hypothetical protein
MGIVPLVLALVIGAAFLHAALVLIPGGARAAPALLILWPNLFALGAPPWLVGQEAETGTLRRLRDLPVAWGRVFSVKGVVASLGLAAVWGAAVLFDAMHGWRGAGVSGAPQQVFSIDSIGGAAWAVVFSVFVMTSGFAVAWWVLRPCSGQSASALPSNSARWGCCLPARSSPDN